jgi:integrase/recombinase XerD
MSQAKTLSSKDIRKVFKRIDLMSQPEQKKAIIALSLSGLRVTELSQITVSDLITKSGKIRSEIALRSAITKGCKPRPVWLSFKTQQILQSYVDYRVNRKFGLSLNSYYQGLNPNSCFILSGKGFPYSLKAKNRVMQNGNIKTYYCSDAVQHVIDEIYRRCGMRGAKSHSGRRSLASNLNAANVPLETIARTLGHSDIQTSLIYIEISPKQLSDAAKLAL